MKPSKPTPSTPRPPRKPLRVARETLRVLDTSDLEKVAGGGDAAHRIRRSAGCYA